jgi:hypothetical protein
LRHVLAISADSAAANTLPKIHVRFWHYLSAANGQSGRQLPLCGKTLPTGVCLLPFCRLFPESNEYARSQTSPTALKRRGPKAVQRVELKER